MALDDDAEDALGDDGGGGWMEGAAAFEHTADSPLLTQLSMLLREGHFSEAV